MLKIARHAWDAYSNLLGVTSVGMFLSAIWAAVGTASLFARLAPLGALAVLFLVLFLRSAWQISISRELKLARQLKCLEFRRRTVLHINTAGDLDIDRSLSITNRSKKPANMTIDEKLGYELNSSSSDWSPGLEMIEHPDGKELKGIYFYSFDHDRPLIRDYEGTIRTVCWGFQIRPYLDPGESIKIQYRIPSSPGTEKSAFSNAGSHFTLIPERAYSKVTQSIHGPPGFRFEVFDLQVLNPGDERGRSEERWLRERHSPVVEKADPTLLRWEIEWPIPGYKYSVRYRLMPIGAK